MGTRPNASTRSKNARPKLSGVLSTPQEGRTLRRKRCDNCGKPFTQRKEHQRFCDGPCRKEFHRAGGVSFVRQKHLIEQMCARQLGELTSRVVDLEAKVDKLAPV